MLTFLRLLVCSLSALVAENLFLRKQLALSVERKAKPRRTTPMFRLSMFTLGRLFDWRTSLVVVKPDTFIRWHRTGFKMFWRWKSRKRGRPALPQNLRELIREMASANATWGEGRIADELSVKLGVHLSPRTVSKYLEGFSPTWR